METERLGTVKWFCKMKGWGFIEPDGGERVRFCIEDAPKGPKTIEVSPVESVTAV